MNNNLLSPEVKILAVMVHSLTFAKEKAKNGRERSRSLLHFL